MTEKKTPAPRKRATPAEKKAEVALSISRAKSKIGKETKQHRLAPPQLAPGVVPEGEKSAIAEDSAFGAMYEFANGILPNGGFTPFPGYPYLANLATRPEYRAFAESLAGEMTREWISFKGVVDDVEDGLSANEDATRIKELEEAIDAFDLKNVFRTAVMHDSFFGRAQIAIKIKGADPEVPLVVSPKTVKKGAVEGFAPVEAIWTTPNEYNSIDPTTPDFYKPRSWFMLGQKIHASRLLTIISRPLPDILKPAYNFSGMSLSQLAEPYVNNWLRTRQSVSDLINNFSLTALATDMSSLTQADCDGADIVARADYFTLMKSNKGLMLLNKDSEELHQLNTPLSGLHELQTQALEHLCVVSRIPSTVLTGIAPTGLNASSEGEIRVFYDWISSLQNAIYQKPLDICIKLIMLDLWGEIDETITWEFNPLWQTSAKEESEIRLNNANAAAIELDRGVISPEEERERLASDPLSGYSGIDVHEVPEQPDDDGLYGMGDLTALDKSVSEKQRRAMAAAAEGKSTLGIPESVGKEFQREDAKA